MSEVRAASAACTYRHAIQRADTLPCRHPRGPRSGRSAAYDTAIELVFMLRTTRLVVTDDHRDRLQA